MELKQLTKLDIYCSEIIKGEIRRSNRKLEKRVKTSACLLHTHSNKKKCLFNDKRVSF